MLADHPHLISTIEQQKLKFLVASNNEPKKDGEGSGQDKKAAGRKAKTDDSGEGPSDTATSESKEDGAGEGMNRVSVGESMHQLKLMNHTSAASTTSKGSEEASSSPTSASVSTYKKVPLICAFITFCLIPHPHFYFIHLVK